MRKQVAITLAGLALCFNALAEVQGLVTEAPTFAGANWKVGGELVQITEQTRVKPSYGRLLVGSCVSFVENDDKSSLKTLPMQACDNTDYEAYFARFEAIVDKDNQ